MPRFARISTELDIETVKHLAPYWGRKDLTPCQFLILANLAGWRKGQVVRTTAATLSERLRVSSATLLKALAVGEDCGVVSGFRVESSGISFRIWGGPNEQEFSDPGAPA